MESFKLRKIWFSLKTSGSPSRCEGASETCLLATSVICFDTVFPERSFLTTTYVLFFLSSTSLWLLLIFFPIDGFIVSYGQLDLFNPYGSKSNVFEVSKNRTFPPMYFVKNSIQNPGSCENPHSRPRFRSQLFQQVSHEQPNFLILWCGRFQHQKAGVMEFLFQFYSFIPMLLANPTLGDFFQDFFSTNSRIEAYVNSNSAHRLAWVATALYCFTRRMFKSS